MTMAPGTRKAALSLHVASSVGWLGAIGAYIALDVTAAASSDASTLRACYVAMGLVTRWVIVPLAVIAFATGILMSLATPWGLFRHWWVVISLALTTFATVVLFIESAVVADLAEAAADPLTSDEAVRGLGTTLVHSIGGAVVLIVVLALNIAKPRGLTRYGWRREQERLDRHAATPSDGNDL
jgi:hypothetical protein